MGGEFLVVGGASSVEENKRLFVLVVVLGDGDPRDDVINDGTARWVVAVLTVVNALLQVIVLPLDATKASKVEGSILMVV